MAVPISSSAPDATTGYSYKDPVLPIGFVVLCVKVVMYSSQGCVINETPRTFIIQCTVQQTIHLNVAINTTFKKGVCETYKYATQWRMYHSYHTGRRLNKEAKAVPLHAMKTLGGRGGIAPTHSWRQCYVPAVLYHRGKDPRYPLYRRMGGPQSRFGHTQARGKILSPLPGIEPRSPGRPAHSQTLHWLELPGSLMGTFLGWHIISLSTGTGSEL
jgi:hypothetical protein